MTDDDEGQMLEKQKGPSPAAPEKSTNELLSDFLVKQVEFNTEVARVLLVNASTGRTPFNDLNSLLQHNRSLLGTIRELETQIRKDRKS